MHAERASSCWRRDKLIAGCWHRAVHVTVAQQFTGCVWRGGRSRAVVCRTKTACLLGAYVQNTRQDNVMFSLLEAANLRLLHYDQSNRRIASSVWLGLVELVLLVDINNQFFLR